MSNKRNGNWEVEEWEWELGCEYTYEEWCAVNSRVSRHREYSYIQYIYSPPRVICVQWRCGRHIAKFLVVTNPSRLEDPERVSVSSS